MLLAAGPAAPALHAALRAHAAAGALPAGVATVVGPGERDVDGLGFGRRDAEAGTTPLDLAVLALGRDATVAPGTGLPALRAARELLVLATGPDRAGALAAMLEAGPSAATPASLLAGHPELTVLCDRAAAARLTPSHHWRSDRAVVVLGHREPGISTEHAISDHSRARLRRAEELCLGDDVRAVVLTGYTHTGGLSEAEQMGREWVIADVPTLLEVAGRDTAENASRSLPIILATGAIRRVAVVTSAWHVRAPFFFAPYRRHGLEVDLVRAEPLQGWGHLLAGELAGVARAPRRRREAFAAVHLPPGASR